MKIARNVTKMIDQDYKLLRINHDFLRYKKRLLAISVLSVIQTDTHTCIAALLQ